MKNYLPFLILLISISSFGQSFWQEDFSNGFPSDWSTEDLSPNNVLWSHCDGANNCNLASSDFNSATASNGFLVVKPPLNVPFESILTTPTIDCSDKEKVVLEFETFVHTVNISAAKGYHLYVKNENEDWMQYELLPEQNKQSAAQLSHNPEKITIDISEMAAMNSEVQIRWEWNGFREQDLALDDVKIYDYEPYYEKVIWGHEPGQGDFDGGMNGWTTETKLPFDHPTFKWEWEEHGSVLKAFSISRLLPFREFKRDFPYVNSYSNDNGAMVFNADFFSTMGTMPPPNPPQDYVSELISPIIDLSDVQNDINLRFEQLAMLGGKPQIPSITFFSFSKDGGVTWEDPIPFNENVNFDQIHQSRETISLCGVAGSESFRMKFTFSGQFYFWAIDDVVLVEKDSFDLQIKRNFYSVAPNYQTPASQVEPLFFLVDIENFGTEIEKNVDLSVTVTDLSDDQIVFQESKILDTIGNCELRGNEILGRFVPPGFPAKYEVEYKVVSNGIDPTPDNNSLKWNFEITEKTYAKESGRTTGIRPNDTNEGFEYGNCFFLENGDGFKIDSIIFGLDDPERSAGAELNLFIYRFFGDADEDAFVDVNERDIVGVGTYRVKGSEHLTSNGLVKAEILNVDSLEQVGVDAESGAFYLATVQYFNGRNLPCPLQASQAIDYTGTYFMYDSLNLPRFAGIESDMANRFDLLSLIDLIPVVRMNLTERTVAVTDINEQPLLIHPNPIKDHFELISKAKSPNDILELYNLKGQLLKKWNANDSDFSIEEFSKGIYFLKMKTEKEIFVGKVIKG